MTATQTRPSASRLSRRRPRKAQLVASGDTTTIQEAAWLGDGRLASRTITNSGVENSANDGGNAVVHAYYANRNPDRQGGAAVVEERNGSNQVVRAYLWDRGTGYQPVNPVWLEVNGDPTIGNDTNPDVAATGEGAESPADGRYFYHTDAAGTVVALTEYAAGAGSVNGRIVERYTRNPHGAALVLAGDSGSGELSAAGVATIVGNPFGAGAGGGSGERSSVSHVSSGGSRIFQSATSYDEFDEGGRLSGDGPGDEKDPPGQDGPPTVDKCCHKTESRTDYCEPERTTHHTESVRIPCHCFGDPWDQPRGLRQCDVTVRIVTQECVAVLITNYMPIPTVDCFNFDCPKSTVQIDNYTTTTIWPPSTDCSDYCDCDWNGDWVPSWNLGVDLGPNIDML